MGGWHLRMTWGQEVCYALLHSEPASALGLPIVRSLWGNPRMARCWEMSTLPAGYILQCKVTLVSSSGFHCVWSVVGWLIVYQDGDYLYSGQYSQTICRSQIGWYLLQSRNILKARPSTYSWKAGPGDVMTVKNLFIILLILHFSCWGPTKANMESLLVQMIK